MTDPPIYRHLAPFDGPHPLEAYNGARWEWNPRRWHWMSYTSPSGKYGVKWRGPRVRTIYRPQP